MGTKLQYLGWDAFIITSPQGVRLLLDPFITGEEKTGVPASTVKVEDVEVDLICASHASKDHFGNGFEILRNNPEAKLLGGVDIMYHAENEGFGTIFDGRAELMVSGCLYNCKDLHIRTLDARHISWTRTDVHGVPVPVTGVAHCYVISVDEGPTFFFGGDTSITSDFELWGKIYRPDVAMLGIGGTILYGGRSLDELDPVEAAIGAQMLGCKLVVPMHYAKPEYLEWFHRECEGRLDHCKCLDMVSRDVVEFDKPLPYRKLR